MSVNYPKKHFQEPHLIPIVSETIFYLLFVPRPIVFYNNSVVTVMKGSHPDSEVCFFVEPKHIRMFLFWAKSV